MRRLGKAWKELLARQITSIPARSQAAVHIL
jgi:hypothetical protein